MPTDPRPVVPGLELRERLCQQLDRLTGQMLAPIVVDAILAEIAASGYSIVATDRFERLRHHAELLFRDFPLAQEAGIGPPDRDKRLLPGDLDPVGPGEGAS